MIHATPAYRVMSIPMSGLGDRLRLAREAAGLTQEQIATKMRTTQTVISAWESDHPGSRTISFRRLRDFAKATGTTPEAIDPERAAYHPHRPRPRPLSRPTTAPAPAPPRRADRPARDRLIALIDVVCETDADWNDLRRIVLEFAANRANRSPTP